MTIVMNALDMVFHLLEGTAVHLNYVAVKLTVIFATVFLMSWWVGLGRAEGIFVSIFGPFIFYVYYKFASSTLNRALFRIDEQFWYVFIHVLLLAVAYWTTYRFLLKQKYKGWVQALGRGFLIAFTMVALDFVYLMARVAVATGRNEEAVARTLNLGYALGLLMFLFALATAVYGLMKRQEWSRRCIVGAGAGVFVFFFGIDQSWAHSVVVFVLAIVVAVLQRWVRT